MNAKEALDPAVVIAKLKTKWLGRPIYYYPVVGSTNELLKEMAARGEPAGTMVLTDYQRRGRGRHGRRWEAPATSALLFSLLFRPKWPAGQVTWLTMIAGLAAVEAIYDETGMNALIKWPNDVLIIIDGRWRKVAGLLLEGTFQGNLLHTGVLGTGINVNVQVNDLPQTKTPASSLLVALGRPVSRLSLLVTYLSHLERHYQAAVRGRTPQPAWNERLQTLGTQVRVTGTSSDEPLEGLAEGTDAWGRLLVRDSAGILHTLSAGDVTLQS